jgi:hypothetical protein
VDPREPLPISPAKEPIEAMSMPSYGIPHERPVPFSYRQAPYSLREPAAWVLSTNEKIWE